MFPRLTGLFKPLVQVNIRDFAPAYITRLETATEVLKNKLAVNATRVVRGRFGAPKGLRSAIFGSLLDVFGWFWPEIEAKPGRLAGFWLVFQVFQRKFELPVAVRTDEASSARLDESWNLAATAAVRGFLKATSVENGRK